MFDWITSSGGGDIGRTAQGIIVVGFFLFVLLVAGLFVYGVFFHARRGVRAFRGRDRAMSLPRHALRLLRRGAVVAGREIVQFAGELVTHNTRDAKLTRQLGTWPAIYRRYGGFVLKAPHVHPKHVNLPGPAALGTGAVFGFIVFNAVENQMRGGRGLLPGFITWVICGALSYPVWLAIFRTRLLVGIDAVGVSWNSKPHSGHVSGTEGPDGWVLAMEAQHPSGPEEMRLFNERMRVTGQNVSYRPAYHNASMLVAQSGFRGRNWEFVAEIARDFRGKKAFRLKTAIEFLQKQALEEELAAKRQAESSQSGGLR